MSTDDVDLEQLTLVNASTYPIAFELGSPMTAGKFTEGRPRKHRFEVEPLKAVQVFRSWTEKNLDSRGRALLPSTIEQYAPFLKPEGHPDLAKARQAITNAKLRAEGKPIPENASHKYCSWPPSAEELGEEAKRKAVQILAGTVR
jgi:hypothetical protein